MTKWSYEVVVTTMLVQVPPSDCRQGSDSIGVVLSACNRSSRVVIVVATWCWGGGTMGDEGGGDDSGREKQKERASQQGDIYGGARLLIGQSSVYLLFFCYDVGNLEPRPPTTFSRRDSLIHHQSSLRTHSSTTSEHKFIHSLKHD
ncbi:hypothetical protein D8674_004491 [Pyrus ussuriensis x Pyrus communis]|uniref:Uncharacterized protein n=1 Tax=Pyrus ussuriensis x Pyrus communis TaxID=2448454 RepID=A0A5N5FK30_9ROSA|nr:hypothetical protein D8674_004491 [Pyrus ussuriensis x Pyrus communis]